LLFNIFLFNLKKLIINFLLILKLKLKFSECLQGRGSEAYAAGKAGAALPSGATAQRLGSAADCRDT
jgi:hypothetical protein